MSVLTGRFAMLKRTAGYSDLLFTFRGLPRRPVWVGWLTAAVFAQGSPEHYRLPFLSFVCQLFPLNGRNRRANDRECKSTILFTLAGMPVRAPAFFAGGLIWRDIPVNPLFPSSLTASYDFVTHPGAMPRQGQVPFSLQGFYVSHSPSVGL